MRVPLVKKENPIPIKNSSSTILFQEILNRLRLKRMERDKSVVHKNHNP